VAVKLHRCGTRWIKGPHPCWQLEHALQEAGVDYEVVVEPWFPRGRRAELIEHTGQKLLPAIELEDGTWWRAESKEMIEAIRAGKLASSSPAP
jgi:glutathione S-transferase